MTDLNQFGKEYLGVVCDNNFTKGNIHIIFNNIKNELLKIIPRFNYILGCVAWVTDFDILDALANVKSAQLIINKEDFLRPEVRGSSNFKRILREKYNKITNHLDRYQHHYKLTEMSYCTDPSIEGVRCVGVKGDSYSPRMHNKFLVFGEQKYSTPQDPYGVFYPHSVWTGSFNLTKMASNSFENVLYIEDEVVANMYYRQYCEIASLSEPLDWTSEYIQPEWRVGS